nr:pyocin S6 family toxin immunity protein [Pseudomonas kilonensis]
MSSTGDAALNGQIVQLLGHGSLNAMAEGEWLLTNVQATEISKVIGVSLPTNLDLFIGVLT